MALAQTASDPVMRQDGNAMTVTTLVLVEVHPVELVVVKVNVKVPADRALTDTEEPVVEPTMVPFPAILHV